MRVLGMALWREKLSDEQYIERIRKGLRMRHRLRYVAGVIQLCLLAMVVWLFLFTIRFLSDFNNLGWLTKNKTPSPEQEGVYFAYFGAILMGFFVGFMFYKALFFIAETFLGFRRDKLLVDCWDALSDAEKGRLRQQGS
jgi:ABC-type phosphate transport system permease subunit